MKILPLLLSVFLVQNLNSQLSFESQRIYDSCIVNNPSNVTYAINNGVQIISTPDSSSFYLQWIPPGANPSEVPMIVTLHGSKGNIFNEFKSWHNSAQAHNCSIIAIQYNKYTDIFDFQNGYFQDDTIYSYIDSALTKINYPYNKALLHGFSLGSARTYAVIYNDILSGKNYFCSTISNAGKIDLTYPLYAELNTINNVFVGKHWNLFCGPPENPVQGEECEGQDFTQSWLLEKGAYVDIYIQEPLLGHSGFQLNTSDHYKDTMLLKYLECYNSSNSISETKNDKITLYPNPTLNKVQIISKNLSINKIEVITSNGKKVIETNDMVFSIENLGKGLYFVRLHANEETFTYKLIVD